MGRRSSQVHSSMTQCLTGMSVFPNKETWYAGARGEQGVHCARTRLFFGRCATSERSPVLGLQAQLCLCHRGRPSPARSSNFVSRRHCWPTPRGRSRTQSANLDWLELLVQGKVFIPEISYQFYWDALIRPEFCRNVCSKKTDCKKGFATLPMAKSILCLLQRTPACAY